MKKPPGEGDRDLRAHAASKASLAAQVRKAIRDGAAPMARAASPDPMASQAHRASRGRRARAGSRGHKASPGRRDLPVRAAKQARPASCRRSSR